MPVRRLAAALAAAGLVVVFGLSAGAQFGNPLKRLPKPPSVPGVKTPAPPASSARKDLVITDDLIARFIKAVKVQKDVLAKEMVEVEAARARAVDQKAKADALTTRRAETMVGTMMQTDECKDRIKDKDPRTKEAQRLYSLAEAASGRGDEAKAEDYQNKASQLESALDIEADRACGGKGTSALVDCMEKKKGVLAKQGVTEPMLSIQAQGECMQDPTTSGFAGAAGPSAAEQAARDAEQAANDAAAERMRLANENADRAGREAAGLDEQTFARLDHCIRNRIGGGPGCSEDANVVIDRHREALRRALGA